jgi:hypothetical protein
MAEESLNELIAAESRLAEHIAQAAPTNSKTALAQASIDAEWQAASVPLRANLSQAYASWLDRTNELRASTPHRLVILVGTGTGFGTGTGVG